MNGMDDRPGPHTGSSHRSARPRTPPSAMSWPAPCLPPRSRSSRCRWRGGGCWTPPPVNRARRGGRGCSSVFWRCSTSWLGSPAPHGLLPCRRRPRRGCTTRWSPSLGPVPWTRNRESAPPPAARPANGSRSRLTPWLPHSGAGAAAGLVRLRRPRRNPGRHPRSPRPSFLGIPAHCTTQTTPTNEPQLHLRSRGPCPVVGHTRSTDGRPAGGGSDSMDQAVEEVVEHPCRPRADRMPATGSRSPWKRL